MSNKMVVVAMTLTAQLILAGCAHKPPVTWRLDCQANVAFERCGEVFESESACREARHQMIRSDNSARNRGTCLRQ